MAEGELPGHVLRRFRESRKKRRPDFLGWLANAGVVWSEGNLHDLEDHRVTWSEAALADLEKAASDDSLIGAVKYQPWKEELSQAFNYYLDVAEDRVAVIHRVWKQRYIQGIKEGGKKPGERLDPAWLAAIPPIEKPEPEATRPEQQSIEISSSPSDAPAIEPDGREAPQPETAPRIGTIPAPTDASSTHILPTSPADAPPTDNGSASVPPKGPADAPATDDGSASVPPTSPASRPTTDTGSAGPSLTHQAGIQILPSCCHISAVFWLPLSLPFLSSTAFFARSSLSRLRTHSKNGQGVFGRNRLHHTYYCKSLRPRLGPLILQHRP